MSLIPFGFWAASGAGGGGGAFDLLETTTLTSSASSVTFSGLGAYSGYKSLQIRTVISADFSGSIWLRANSDTGSNYAWHRLQGNGSSAASQSATTQSKMEIHYVYGLGWSAGVYDLLDFSSTSKYKTFRGLGGVADATSVIRLMSGLWQNTSAVTSLTISPPDGGYNLLTGSRFSLYGVK